MNSRWRGVQGCRAQVVVHVLTCIRGSSHRSKRKRSYPFPLGSLGIVVPNSFQWETRIVAVGEL